MNFKAGDKVVALVSVTRVAYPQDSITAQEVYTVSRTEDDGQDVYLEGKTQYFSASRFKAFEGSAIDFSKPLETGDGRPVVLVTATGRGDYPVLAYVGDQPTVTSFTKDGKYYTGTNTPALDLRNVPPKPLERELYVNINKTGDFLTNGRMYVSRREADHSASSSRVGCMKITMVEGQYDE